MAEEPKLLEDDWKPIETQPMDGSQIEIKFRNGETCIGPACPITEPSRKDRLEFAKLGHWPDAGWTPEYWRNTRPTQQGEQNETP